MPRRHFGHTAVAGQTPKHMQTLGVSTSPTRSDYVVADVPGVTLGQFDSGCAQPAGLRSDDSTRSIWERPAFNGAPWPREYIIALRAIRPVPRSKSAENRATTLS